MGTVILAKVLTLDAPRLIAASSMLMGICISVAVAERIVYGIRRIANDIIIIAIVPVSAMGLEP